MEKLNVLLLGSGGRESALALKISLSERLNKLFIAPGNGGTAAYGENVALAATDFAAIGEFVNTYHIDMIVVGSEEPLVKGIKDFMTKTAPHVLVVGPGADGARLEGSKDFAKDFMMRHNIPTAAYRSFTAETLADGQLFLESLEAPYVLKADGLAAGKGVLIIENLDEAKAALAEMLSGMFGGASATVVIEEFMSGIECSVFVLTDGHGGYRVLPVAKDYKRIGEGDKGLNTGGMGAVSPVCFADDTFMAKVVDRIIEPTVQGLIADGVDYRGFIFLGLIDVDGEPKVIEYNVRMGDPETEVVMLRLKSDLLTLLEGAARGNLADISADIDPRYAVTVVLASGGYPGDYAKNIAIGGDLNPEGAVIYHAGTRINDAGALVTSGGRVMMISAMGDTLDMARDKAYAAADAVSFDGKYCRRDIGLDMKALEQARK
jgi:phosphoribosylamine--glycine ligase